MQAAISKLDGVGGKPAWAWIFILEGLATVVAGALSFFIIQDFPDTATFLTEEERTFVVRRLQADSQHSAAGEDLKWHYVLRSVLDWKTWVGSACVFLWDRRGLWSDGVFFFSPSLCCVVALYMGADGPLYAFSLFLPSIINQLGKTRLTLHECVFG